MAPAPEAPRLPASADFNAIYNRISLASAKQATFLASMRAKYPSLARPAPAANTPTTAAASASNGTFSSLANPDPSADAPRQPAATRRPQDDDLRLENPNTGLGYAAPKSEQAASAATRDLSRRLLGGNRGRADDPKAAAAALAKRRLRDDESEEEEGRSGVGRSKKRRVRQESPEAEPSPAATPAPKPAPAPEREMAEEEKADVAMNEGPGGVGEGVRDRGEAARADAEKGDEKPNGSAEDAAAPARLAGPDRRFETGETSKKRRKKNRNKQNKAAAVTAAAAAGVRGDS